MPWVIESPTAIIRIVAGVSGTGAGAGVGTGAGSVVGAGSVATEGESPELLAATMQEPLFSHPQPSPSGSAAAEEQMAGPLALLPDEDVLVAVLAEEGELDITMQELLFSHPQPSPSGSAAAEEHIARPLLVLPELLLVVALAAEDESVVTMQVALFSQPQPSPSASAAGLEQNGSAASAEPAVISNNDADRSWQLFLRCFILAD